MGSNAPSGQLDEFFGEYIMDLAMTNFKIGEMVKIKPGLVGAGMTGVIQKIEPWNLDSPYIDFRENYYWLIMEDGIKIHFHGDMLEKIDTFDKGQK